MYVGVWHNSASTCSSLAKRLPPLQRNASHRQRSPTRAHRKRHEPQQFHELRAAARVAVAAARSYPEDVNLRLVPLLALALCVGCASRYVTRGADLYAGGRYIEAA